MRILYLNHNVAGSGTFQRASHIAAGAAERGHDVTLITTRRRGRIRGVEVRHRGVRVIEAPDLLSGGGRNGWDPWNTAWRMQRLARSHYDLVHAFDCRPVVIGPGLLQRRLSGAALFVDWADWWGRGGAIGERPGRAARVLLGSIETWLEESFRTGATANTVISTALRDRCIGLGVSPERVLTFPNGCEPPARDRSTARVAARAELGLRATEPVLLHLGVAYPGDVVLMFDAVRRVVAQEPSTRLALIGAFQGTIPEDLLRDGVVIRPGFVSSERLKQWLAAADAGVIPLRDNLANRARWPGKINEYFSAGLPVVTTDVGAAADYVRRHDAGLTCEPEPEALSEALLEVLADADARRAMSEAGEALAEGELAWSGMLDRLFEFYDQWHVPLRARRASKERHES